MIRRKHTPPTDAEQAHAAAIVNLAAAERRTPEVRKITESLRDWREQNHVVAQLEKILYGH